MRPELLAADFARALAALEAAIRALSVYDELPGFATALRSLLGAFENQLVA